MATSPRNVLRVNAVEETEDYRKAVAKILLNIQRDHDQTLVDIAETIGVSLGTISNAANKKADLSPTFLKRLGNAYGPCTLDPFAHLVGAALLPLGGGNVTDLLPLVGRVNLKIAEARDPAGPGGAKEIHTEQLDMLPDLRALKRRLAEVIAEIERLAA
ncbi:MAG TPA: helix-turn-helix transcriptional regulator [Sphingopyxis sp.]|nr:helix-turn-helix transcriptional regulator [Sphingopyxis sp.]